jgi:transposase
MAVAPWVVSDELWEWVEPLLPKKARRFRYPGRKRLPDRKVCGILFVLHTGSPGGICQWRLASFAALPCSPPLASL